MSARGLQRFFIDPPREFGFMPFWFWNDDLTDTELVRQIREMHAKGFGGVVVHPRNGLSRRIGYLTPEFFRLMRVAVEELARLGMKVILYDEAGYPSGSCQGRVVARNPDWAAKCIFPQEWFQVKGPARGFLRPNPGRALGYKLVAVVTGREVEPGKLDPDTLRCLKWDEHEVVDYDLPAGDWRIVAVWEGHSGGTIRGVFEEEEDDHALAPPAADILREDAVACFLQLTHDQYYEHLKDHFGRTIVAMFTDEPSPMGRCGPDGPTLRRRQPWTPGFLAHVRAWWDEDVARWLTALWFDCGPRTAKFRWAWHKAVQQRLEQAFYKPIGEWCAAHGIALTGHSGDGNELGMLRHFQWPGQDMVWRWLTPDNPHATDPRESLTAKAASSAARLGGRRFSGIEVFGAYGWRLTLDEVKWLLDWYFVRGTNLVFPHAAFYSIRGRRAYESEPDLTVHNVWWPHFGLLGDYGRRMCWMLSDGDEICETGIVSDGDSMAWEAAWILEENQQDFIFVDDPALRAARVEGGRLMAGEMKFRLLLIDRPGTLSPGAEQRLREFEASGGTVLRTWDKTDLIEKVAAVVGRDVEWQGTDAAALRVLHYRKNGLDLYLLVNEGEAPLDGQALLSAAGGVERWNALDGSFHPWPAKCDKEGKTRVPVRLERRESIVLAVDPAGKPDPTPGLPARPGAAVAEITGPWRVTNPYGKPTPVPAPGDWAQTEGWELFAGTLCYHATFTLNIAQQAKARFLDLGTVRDIAEVWLNGRRLGVRAWAPHVLTLGDACCAGENRLEIRVTNSMANACDGTRLPSGLIGPVTMRAAREEMRP